MMRSAPRREPYASRRRELMERLHDGAIVVRGEAAGGPSPDLFYLTGVADASAILLLVPRGAPVRLAPADPGPDYLRGREVRQALFLPPSDPVKRAWGEEPDAVADGDRALDPEELDYDAVFPLARFPAVATQVLGRVERVRVARGHAAALGGEDDPDTRFARTLRDRFLHLVVDDATAALHEMRRLKSAEEVAAIRRAGEVVDEALRRLLARMEPGVREAELEAELTRVYRARGGGHAFDPIVASGANALQLHYTKSSGTLREGDLLLVDTGAQVDGYCADVSRTYPVGGRFGDRQRELYDAVLRAQRATLERCAPGALLADLHEAAWRSLDRDGLGAEFPHGIGHHLGLETHDVGDGRKPLAAGAVITVEPGVYLAGEGVGIRIEDDVHVVDGGCELLTDRIAREADAVEAEIAAARDRSAS